MVSGSARSGNDGIYVSDEAVDWIETAANDEFD